MTAPVITLDNCDSEPIHIPGLIQAHGALIGLNALGVVDYTSDHSPTLLGVDIPSLGETLAPAHFSGNAVVARAIANGMESLRRGNSQPQSHALELNGRSFDLIVHISGETVVAEFEGRSTGGDALQAFAFDAQRGMDRLRRQRTVQSLLEVAVTELRELTGFDRVMAYRFRHDDSGEVVAEARAEQLEPFLNMRYPASDIPAQARRLYVINTLRLIADVGARPVALNSRQAAPLDMSHCVLRSVSPVHIEYLTNMGVGASMSVSIVIDGRLWGMLACHHVQPKHVPYQVRVACDILAQVLSANLHGVLAQKNGERIAKASQVRANVMESVLHADNALLALTPLAPQIKEIFSAHDIILAEHGKVWMRTGATDHAAARELVKWLQAGGAAGQALWHVDSLKALPAYLQGSISTWCGILALQFDSQAEGWVVLLRRQQVETISWGGNPEKTYVNGPLGPRLTPRGSFKLWQQTVEGTALPWSQEDLDSAQQLLDDILRSNALRNAELHRSQTELLAMLGHDLRDPLQSISMAATLLQRSAAHGAIGARIRSSTDRMQRLVSQVLDVASLRNGSGLQFNFQDVPLTSLAADVIDELAMAFPDSRFTKHFPPRLVAWADPDRMAQLLGNLLGNARHHGMPGETILIQLSDRDGMTEIVVSNHGEEIDAETAGDLFRPFNVSKAGVVRNKGGLGLGLYIAREVMAGHGGTLEYAYAEPYVVFTARFPTRSAA